VFHVNPYFAGESHAPEKPAVSGHCLETAATNDQDAFF
jgi:hypothetical protein